MMIFPQRMKRLTAVILKNDADKLTLRLLDAGVMDFIDVHSTGKELELGAEGRIKPIESPETAADLADTRNRIETFLENAHIPLPQVSTLDTETLQKAETDKSNKELDKLAAGIQQIRDNQQGIQQEINRLQELHRQISLFEEITELVPTGSYVDIQAGLIGKSRYNSLISGLKGFPAYVHRGGFEQNDESGSEISSETDNSTFRKNKLNSTDSYEYPVLLIFMTRDADSIGKLLDRIQWKTIEIPDEFRGMRSRALEELKLKISEAEKKQTLLASSAELLVTEQQGWLEETWKNLRMNELFSTMQSNYGKTSDTVIFSGWIPAHRTDKVTKGIEEITQGRCYLEWTVPEENNQSIPKKDIPVLMEHPRAFLPFQWLVENYSIPRYGTIDPTVLVSVTYLMMFGLMFGDAGQGVILLIIGSLIARFRKNSTAKLGKLIMWCGGASVIAGVLFGSYFGNAWLPPLWFNYHGIVSGHGGVGSGGISASYITTIYDILGITIKFGIGIISCGIILNCINRFRSKEWFHLFFDHGGLLAGWFYAGGVYTGFKFVNSGYSELPPAGTLLLVIGLPLIIFAAKAPLEFIDKMREAALKSNKDAVTQRTTPTLTLSPAKIPGFIMDWIVELLELFTNYLSNTLSFMRVAGLGIAHVSLMVVFMQIAGSISSPILSILILILGNSIVIVLEGLSAGIQALRLHYYEFFSKYFCGSGRVYHPISLR